ncbi:MAG: thiamine-phosphate kinase [Nitrospinae bacterium]|nr:thiamine-phosphate kinase [Nitrospinota bacterium]
MKLSQIGEFGLIKQIRDTFTPPIPPFNKGGREGGVVVGIGDDCAAIKPREGFLIITTTDSLTENIHFKLDYIQPFQLGLKSIYINLSDIAAMGGIPLYALLSLSIPPSFSVEFMNEFLKGVKDAADRYKVSVIGGNISSSKNDFSIHITIIGEIEKEHMVLRKGAKAGDRIFVTGWLGDSAAGLEILKRSQKTEVRSQIDKKLKERHLIPTPRLKEGRFLAINNLATSMIDISDGLASDLKRICEESGVGANIFTENIPVSEELRDFTSHRKSFEPIDLALYEGEDYELLFTVKSEIVENLKSLWNNKMTSITMIGEVTKGEINLIHKSGGTIPLQREGYNHFKT